MRSTRLWGLLWMSFLLELQDVAESPDVTFAKTEGQTMKLLCPFNIQTYSTSQKAWQRLIEGAEPKILAVTESNSEQINKVQVGKYSLEDMPSEGVLIVQMTDLRQEDSGLYQCVIYQPPRKPFVLYNVHLEVTKDPVSGGGPTSNLGKTPTLPAITTTTKARTKLPISPSTVTQPLPTSIVSPSEGPHVVIRISPMGIIIIVTCGILTKSLVFTVLLVVTQRSFGH